MRTANATYVAPLGDSKVVEMGGVTFFDGKSVELNSEEHNGLIDKLAGNPHFDIDIGEDDKKPVVQKKVGRPSKEAKAREAAIEQAEADKKAAIDKAEEDFAKQASAKPEKPQATDAPVKV